LHIPSRQQPNGPRVPDLVVYRSTSTREELAWCPERSELAMEATERHDRRSLELGHRREVGRLGVGNWRSRVGAKAFGASSRDRTRKFGPEWGSNGWQLADDSIPLDEDGANDGP